MRDIDGLAADERQLVTRAAEGDQAAFGRLYREHAGHIYAVCLRMLADGERAKEVAQETIIRIWNRLSTFRGESPFSAWIHRIAVNTVLDHLRSDKRRGEHVEFTDDLDRYDRPGGADADSPAGLSMDLEQAIASLPARARIILVLHDIEGYRHEEIAEMLSIVPGTSKAHLHRARNLLKERVER